MIWENKSHYGNQNMKNCLKIDIINQIINLINRVILLNNKKIFKNQFHWMILLIGNQNTMICKFRFKAKINLRSKLCNLKGKTNNTNKREINTRKQTISYRLKFQTFKNY